MKRTTTWLAVMVAAAATATVMAASPSSADTFPTSATATASVGWAHFDAYTQVLSIYDAHPDGYGIAVVNNRSDLANPGPYYGWNRDGYGTTVYYDLHMPNLASIRFYVCPEQDGVILSYTGRCGTTAIGYAGVEI
ncbi:MAG TPA: hypothetical protein VGJ07_17585 [Rugosimonospora sp.]